MLAKIQKWGNSQGLRLSKSLLADARLEVGDEVDIRVEEGALIITPASKIRGRYRLEDFVDNITEDHQPEEVDWGGPAGKEVW
jgi:antitoxin MazE